MTLADLKAMFVSAGCKRVYAKVLAENDNSKNQVYFGPDFQALNLLPNKGIQPDKRLCTPIFKAPVAFSWMDSNGDPVEAPGAQLILYPQYPEVRFSGFLRACAAAPSKLMTTRLAGRILFLGVTADRRIIGYAISPDSATAAEYRASQSGPQSGVFVELPLPTIPDSQAARDRLLIELARIHNLGWINSKQLSENGALEPCNAQQCGGFTLEAELGIPKNSRAEPDFLGWEIKQHHVPNFDHVESGVITLMTPEPTGGLYKDQGPEAFVRRFGYPDKKGRPDRLNFGGVHRVGILHPQTKLTLSLSGFDTSTGKITDANGAIALVTAAGDIAAMWHFAGLLIHWTRKHAKAAYVPSHCRAEPARLYCYGHTVRLALQTDFLLFLKAMAAGNVYYDPGLKLENESTSEPQIKRRNQFRILSRNIPSLYGSVEKVDISAHD